MQLGRGGKEVCFSSFKRRETRLAISIDCNASYWKDTEFSGFPAWRRRISWSPLGAQEEKRIKHPTAGWGWHVLWAANQGPQGAWLNKPKVRISNDKADYQLGNDCQKQLDLSRQPSESKTRALFQHPLLSCSLSSTAVATNFGSSLLIGLMRENTNWLRVSHCRAILKMRWETFFYNIFLKNWPLFGQL